MSDKTLLEQKILDKAKGSASEILKKEQERSRILQDSIRKQADADLAGALEQAVGRGQMIRKEYEASAHLEAKLMFLEKKDEIIARVLQQAWEQLKVRAKRDDYAAVVCTMILEGVRALGLKEAVVTLGPNEKQVLGSGLVGVSKDVSSKVGWPVKIQLSSETLNSLGGVRVSDPQRHMLYDNTWDARLERIRQDLAVEISEILFGDETTEAGQKKSRVERPIDIPHPSLPPQGGEGHVFQ